MFSRRGVCYWACIRVFDADGRYHSERRFVLDAIRKLDRLFFNSGSNGIAAGDVECGFSRFRPTLPRMSPQ